MSKMIKSKKYTGVYHRKKANGDFTYYIIYKDLDNKPIYHKVGLKSQGIDEQYVSEKRTELILELKNGEVPTILRSKKKFILKFSEIADYYFNNRKCRSIEKRRQLYEL